MNFMSFMVFVRYQFLHWFVMSCGIDIGSIYASLSWLFVWWLLRFFFKLILMKYVSKRCCMRPFRTFFYTLLPFAGVRPTSARNICPFLFSKIKRMVSTLVPFSSVRPTRAPWPFLQFWRNKINVVFLKIPWLTLAHFDSLLVAFWLFWLLFLIHLDFRQCVFVSLYVFEHPSPRVHHRLPFAPSSKEPPPQ